VARYPAQVIVLKPTPEIIRLQDRDPHVNPDEFVDRAHSHRALGPTEQEVWTRQSILTTFRSGHFYLSLSHLRSRGSTAARSGESADLSATARAALNRLLPWLYAAGIAFGI
jgi:hypothetical protein